METSPKAQESVATGNPPQPDSQATKTPLDGTKGPRNSYQRKTRDEYMLLADLRDGLGLQPTGLVRDNWEQMRRVLQAHRKSWPENRYSYRMKKIKIESPARGAGIPKQGRASHSERQP